MKSTAKATNQAVKPTVSKKPDGKPKVKFGTGRHLAFMSDTLFDDDLNK